MNPTQAKRVRSLEAHVAKQMQTLARPGVRLLVAVSGGPDSLALLHLLHACAAEQRLRLEVLHFDHGVRAESAREADWVRACAMRLGLLFHCRQGDFQGLRTGFPAAARRWRQREAAQLLTERQAFAVATGHQQDDLLETMLMQALRGTHLTRWRGMQAHKGPFLRPLLECPRAALLCYLRDRGEVWLEDPTNRDPRYLRNRVRHELLPLLNTLARGRMDRRLLAWRDQATALSAWVATLPTPAQSAAEDTQPWISAEALIKQPHFLASAFLHDFIQQHSPGSVSVRHVEAALQLLHKGRPRWTLHLPGKRSLYRREERLYVLFQGAAK